MNKLDKVKETIRNLRSRASNKASSEAETLAALDKVEKMMKKHKITVDDLKEAAGKGSIITKDWTQGTKKLHPVELVAGAAAQMSDTRGWIDRFTNESKIVFAGFEPDVEYAMYLIDLIHNAMEAEWEKFRSSPAYAGTDRNKRGRLRVDFMRGMAVRLRERMMDIVADRRMKQSQEKSGKGTELVVAKREMVAAAMDDMGVSIRKRRKSKVKVDAAAYFSGKAAADRTNITTGIGNAPS